MQSVNRTAVVIKPKQPFVDWLNSIPGESSDSAWPVRSRALSFVKLVDGWTDRCYYPFFMPFETGQDLVKMVMVNSR